MIEATTLNCPQCGEPAHVLVEGYCEPCRSDNQIRLDTHNIQYDAWEKMSDRDRGSAIKFAGEG